MAKSRSSTPPDSPAAVAGEGGQAGSEPPVPPPAPMAPSAQAAGSASQESGRPDDSALIAAYRQGDQAALGTLLTRHQGMLFNTVLRMVSNRDDAMEVSQEAMLKIVQHIDNFREDARFTTWATRIAMNCAISRLRRRKIRRTQSLDAPMGHDPSAGSMVANLANPKEPGPAERVQHSDRLDLVRRAIDELEEPFRSVLVLRDVQGLEYEEIAQVLEIAKGTVKSRLFRARLAMRQIVRKYDPDVPDESPSGTP